MIINDKVEVNVFSSNVPYYESLGYKIPRYKNDRGKLKIKRGTKITVKVEDLPKGSTVKLRVKCDKCGKEYDMIYSNYIKQNHNGKTYCKHCFCTVLLSGENNGMYGRIGKNHPNWDSSKTDEERMDDRSYPKYKEFVKKAFERDNYTCQCCGDNKGHNLIVHHLDSYNWCKEKRIDETNGITLCEECHKEFHHIYGYGNNTKEQFEDFIKNKENQETA